MTKEFEPKEDRDKFDENWCLYFALHNTEEHGLADTLDKIEEWATALLSQNVDHPFPLPFPLAGKTTITAPLDDRKIVPDEGALIDDVVAQGGGFAEIFAVRFIGRVRGLRHAILRGESEMAVVGAMALGALSVEFSMAQHYWLAESIYMGGRKGAERQWGPSEAKRKEHDDLRRLYEEHRPTLPTNQAAYDAVAQLVGVNWRTVRRAVTGH